MSTVVCWFKRKAARAGTDGQMDRQTDRQTDTHDDYRNPLAHARRGLTTVTLAHARRGLTSCVGYLYTISEWFNHSEPPRAFSALKWFEKGGSLWLNHSEIVYRYPTHLVTTVKMRFEKVRYSRTTPNSRQRLLHAFLSLH